MVGCCCFSFAFVRCSLFDVPCLLFVVCCMLFKVCWICRLSLLFILLFVGC